MKLKLLTLLAFFITTIVVGQEAKTITGTVQDPSEIPLPGAEVKIVDKDNFDVTDFDGKFTLENVEEGDVLRITYLGFSPQEVTITESNDYIITLQEDAAALDEVVVVGYGTQQKQDITGSIAVVSGEELNKQPNVNPLSSVQGKVAGVNITNSGRPGSSPNVRIRGVGSVSNSDPLYVVDGVLTDNIDYLNPADIESLNILKDASSAAIYGIRAANGVIVIETKNGRGEGVSVSYDGYAGFKKVTNIPDLANASQYIQLYNEKQAFEGSENLLDPNDYNADTDWFEEIIKDAPVITSHNLSVSGSSEKTRYYIGVGYFNEEGILDAGRNINSGNDYTRITGRLNIDSDINDYISFGGSIAYTDTRSNDVQEPFYQAYIAPPIFNAINQDGTYGFPEGVGNFANPRGTLDFYRGKSEGNRVLANVYAEISPIESIQFRTSFSGDNRSNKGFSYTPEYRISTNQGSDISTLNRNNAENDNWLWENTLTWDETFGKHDITVLGGFSREERSFYRIEGIANGVDFNGDDAILYLDLGDVDSERVNDEGTKTHFQSLFGRVQYKFDNRYLLNATIRNDGASNFPSENNTEIFPSVGLGWIVSNEEFMQNTTAINTLKFKGSWGRLGNATVPRGFDVTATNPDIYFFGEQSAIARSISEFSDPSIFWEIVEEYDAGVEFTLFENKLDGEVNYYNRETQDAVFNITQLASSGATNTNLLTNAGSFKNTGVEVSLNWADQINTDLNYSIYGNLTTISNEITNIIGASFLNTGPGLFGNPIIRLEEGAEIGAYYGYQVDGVIQTEAEAAEYNSRVGAFRFADLNGDGLIGEDDKTFLGSPIPEFTYGFGFSLNYKNIDFGMDFVGVAGNEIYNFNRNSRFGNENWDLDFYENRWTPGSNINNYPAPNSDQNSSRPSSFYVEKGDYFRIRNIQLGYTLPPSIAGDSELWDSFRIYLNAQNPLTVFEYNGFSPEINGGSVDNPPGGSVVNSGIDRNVYPLSATYNLGVSLNF
ncbi:TonB-dependent receptor [Zunongwangia sp. F363]|uniref:TonB-dependent receptor n=1 Tax=Autumnicola tepida TaxID=3075595 RepID=A0ABU3C9R6_9FLAO|nr:TonB-dependent receptor [Zunongwangia sp. F363]MDT0643085.1 TonB-dependent receptor [Zunongwangia sp. F363]